MGRNVLRIRLVLAACLLLAAPGVFAQSIFATNSTDGDGTTDTPMTISRNDDMVPLALVLPLTTAAMDKVPPTGLSGEIMEVGANNQFDVTAGAVVLISCDASDYPGNIDQVAVFSSAVERNVAAVLFYSNQADYCRMESDRTGFKWAFSMKSRNDTTNVLSAIADSSAPLWVTIGGPDVQQGRDGPSNSSHSGSGSNTRDNSPQGPLGPNPSTAVAMIILYTITGVITALFLVIIITELLGRIDTQSATVPARLSAGLDRAVPGGSGELFWMAFPLSSLASAKSRSLRTLKWGLLHPLGRVSKALSHLQETDPRVGPI